MHFGREGNIQLGKISAAYAKYRLFVFYIVIFPTSLLCGWVRWWKDCWVGGHHLDCHGYGGKFDDDGSNLREAYEIACGS